MIKKYLSYLLVKRSENNSTDPFEFEKRQGNPFTAFYNDSFYFTGRDDKGTSIVTRLGFRNSGETELWLDMIIPGIGELSIIHEKDKFFLGDNIAYGPVEYTCIEPGRIWRITFKGAMQSGKKKAHVSLDVMFTARMKIFDFKKDGYAWSMAESLASEKWSAKWFSKLKEISQVHYEQGGTMSGFVEINGTRKKLELHAMRDHSFGTRKWTAMDRHLWICGMLEDGRYFNMSIVRYKFLSFIQSGYITEGDTIIPVEKCTHFDEIGEAVEVPKSFTVTIKPLKKDPVIIECLIKGGFNYLMGGDYKIFESLAEYKVGNIKGVGISEFGYNKKIYS